ncbi:hypothetical protein FPZ12_024015 [Amycolatopsis acidicola]|uniref:Uncharacterized protein n=1 Tax=Amycolatopsis acidicola TaxID=2596893 RepID=A0A5N0V1I0_9PSEU|nr:hypothetical protein [Amycolatopsis acidicola]KAA9157952.1 hypothetical protein FPZ12_024015 [Amycolatopsis acidicola]
MSTTVATWLALYGAALAIALAVVGWHRRRRTRAAREHRIPVQEILDRERNIAPREPIWPHADPDARARRDTDPTLRIPPISIPSPRPPRRRPYTRQRDQAAVSATSADRQEGDRP